MACWRMKKASFLRKLQPTPPMRRQSMLWFPKHHQLSILGLGGSSMNSTCLWANYLRSSNLKGIFAHLNLDLLQAHCLKVTSHMSFAYIIKNLAIRQTNASIYDMPFKIWLTKSHYSAIIGQPSRLRLNFNLQVFRLALWFYCLFSICFLVGQFTQ